MMRSEEAKKENTQWLNSRYIMNEKWGWYIVKLQEEKEVAAKREQEVVRQREALGDIEQD